MYPSSEQKTQAILMWILSIPAGFIPPVIFLIIDSNKGFVYKSSAQAIVFMAAIWVAAFVLSPISCLLFGIPHVVLGVLGLAVPIIGAIQANAGKVYDVPITGQIARKWFK